MNNIENHISDSAGYVKFNPAGSDWPADVTNVQLALSKIGSWASTDVGLPIASETVAGIAPIATQEEVTNGTDDTKIVTPLKLEFALRHPEATQAVYGKTRYSTNDEAMDTTNVATTITPLTLNHVFNTRNSTETVAGSLKVATRALAEAGNADNVLMTPLKTKQAIAALTTVYGPGTETAQGIVQLATVAQTQQGTIREGFAISPYTFARCAGTETKPGVFKIATDSQAAALDDNTTVLTPYKLGTLKATTTQHGIVKLVDTPTNQPNSALSANASVLPLSGGTMSGDILFNQSLRGLVWTMNTDMAAVRFKNDSDQDPNSYLEFVVGDNDTEYFRWTFATAGGSKEIMRLQNDGLWLYNRTMYANRVVIGGYHAMSRGLRAVALTSTALWNGGGLRDGSSRFVTGVVNWNWDAWPDTIDSRVLQYHLDGTWYNCSWE